MIALRTLFVGVTDRFDVETSSLQVIVVALISKEFPVTQGTEGGGCGELSAG